MEEKKQKINPNKSLLGRIEKMKKEGNINNPSDKKNARKGKLSFKKSEERKKAREARRARRNERFVTKLLVKIIIFLLIVIALLLLWRGFTKQTIEKKTMVVEQQLIYCQELVTLKYRYSDVISLKKSVPLAKSYSIVKYTGTIRAGIQDMTLCDFEISDTGKSVKVILPDAEILGNDISQQEVFDENHSVFVPITIEEVFYEIDAARQEVLEEFLNQGILEEAKKTAALVIKQLLLTAGFDTVEIY